MGERELCLSYGIQEDANKNDKTIDLGITSEEKP
jgi:hypothetical protein